LKIDKHIEIPLSNEYLQLFEGVNQENLRYLEKNYNVEITNRSNRFLVYGDEDSIDQTFKVFGLMSEYITLNNTLSLSKIKQLIQHGFVEYEKNMKPVTYNTQGKQVYPKTKGQARFINVLENHDMIFAIGPAGTGKTFLAVAFGVKLLRENKVKRIILVRPAVEAGENLGFLPGDLKEKIDPYLQPLYDGLNQLLGAESVTKLIEKQVIEIAPLAYMRGRTLDDAMVILDEAQNTTKSQMKMFLTRMGFNSKMIINGDISQIDLRSRSDSGLLDAIALLKNINEIGMVELTLEDIVRHPLVAKILSKYEGR